jgi:hypothetical protein
VQQRRVRVHLGNVEADGFRTLGIRTKADTFSTEIDARVAIATMPQPFKEAGGTFSIEAADCTASWDSS